MVMNKLNGLIYKSQAYQENSRLLQVFTNKGKITLNAKGSQKLSSKDRIIAQYLNEISFEYNNFKTFLTLQNAKLVNDFNFIKKDFDLTKTASLALEVIDKVIIDDIYNEKIYELLINTLNSKNLELAVLSFSLKILYYLGYGMKLKVEGKNTLGVSILKGGLVYEGETFNLDLNVLESITLLKLTHMKVNDEVEINLTHINSIKRFIYYYYENKMDIKLNALR